MKFIAEHQVAFDKDAVGFPSLDGCLGLVYQTTSGLYGYHLFGGNNNTAANRAEMFADFVDSHGKGQKGTRLYGVCFIQRRGWFKSDGFSADRATAWKEELLIYADKLHHYSGRISGFDLSKHYAGKTCSAYAEFRKVGTKCDLYVREWSDNVDKPQVQTLKNPNSADHIEINRKSPVGGGPATLRSWDLTMVPTSVPRDNLVKVSKQKLRG